VSATEYLTLSRAGPRAAWMALRPLTGRTHQLRAHMLALGHPILGDPKYHNAASVEVSGTLKLQLHARRLEIPHPSGGRIEIEAPLSPEMKAGFARFGFDPHEAAGADFAARPHR
jgi:23S rRNA pseudouridine955/2504/2580 synthase